MQRVRVDFAGKAQARRALPRPFSRCFFGARVVLLGTGRDRPQVVLLLTGTQLAKTQHRFNSLVSITPAAARTAGASASPRVVAIAGVIRWVMVSARGRTSWGVRRGGSRARVGLSGGDAVCEGTHGRSSRRHRLGL